MSQAARGPGPGPADGAPLVEFVAMMRRMRAECAWKAEQTHTSLLPYLAEEAAEVAEAVEEAAAGVPGGAAHLCEELGDLLLQIYFHAAIAEERGEFTIDDVARGLAEKMRRRNPHVFGTDAERAALVGLDADAITARWEEIKRAERA
ncbi:MazG nucleotide pyrophosphohydrolase domain-containing protein [Nocardioides sp.]|uniref:MazG nucleotide pyrophosphohydrolase domain-containing protein n=1 Tax=Nocardioides sp. TaxID=35761 RepID=UPI003516BFEE